MDETGCVIVGAGPAGAVLGLVLARQGLKVTLLESHRDFEREFRGDTVHPAVLEIMDELGLAEKLLQLPHTKVQHAVQPGSGGTLDLSTLRTRFPFIMVVPQARFLELVTAEAVASGLDLRMSARAEQLVEEDGAVRGVRYRQGDTLRELRAPLVVAADGRFSKLRQLAGFTPVSLSVPMDVLWFRLPRRASDPAGVRSAANGAHLLVMLDRTDAWQVGLVILKGSYQDVRRQGLEAFRQVVAETEPLLADRVQELQDWSQLSVLSVESSRLTRWHKPGLLCIGDAAHVMSPVGGVGINFAIQDAVATANLLGPALKTGVVPDSLLEAVQRRREWPTRVVQWLQDQAHRRVVARTLSGRRRLLPPLVLRSGVVRKAVAHVVAFGLRPEHVQS